MAYRDQRCITYKANLSPKQTLKTKGENFLVPTNEGGVGSGQA